MSGAARVEFAALELERAERARGAHGRGAPLEAGQVAGPGAAPARPSNARGNARGRNAPPPRAADWPAGAWRARGAPGGGAGSELVLTAPPGVPPGDLLARKLSAKFREGGAEVTLAAPPFPAWRLKVAVAGMRAACDPGKCRAEALPGAEGGEPERLLVTLAPGAGGESSSWGPADVRQEVPRAGAREETIADYSWLDRERSVSIYLKVPGVHALPPEKVRVRFRELSLDVSVDLSSVVKTFAITELPLEIVVSESRWKTKEDQLVLFLRKWARTSWFKIQQAR